MTLLCSMCTLAADFALYPTGPDQDAAFIRFVNATTAPLDVLGQAGQPPLRLEVAQPASLLFAVDSTSPVKGSLVSGAHTLALDLKVDQPSQPLGATGVRQRQCGCSAGSGHAQGGGALQRATGSFCHGATSFERNGHSVPLIGFYRCHGLRLTRVPDAFFARLYAGLRSGETAVA